jgi:hypothetical protein
MEGGTRGYKQVCGGYTQVCGGYKQVCGWERRAQVRRSAVKAIMGLLELHTRDLVAGMLLHVLNHQLLLCKYLVCCKRSI